MHTHRGTFTCVSPSQMREGQAHIRPQEPQVFHSPFWSVPPAESGKQSLPLQRSQAAHASRTSPGLGLSYVPLTAAYQVMVPGLLISLWNLNCCPQRQAVQTLQSSWPRGVPSPHQFPPVVRSPCSTHKLTPQCFEGRCSSARFLSSYLAGA